MEDTSISIIGIVIATILMFLVPFFLLADRNDDVSQLIAQTATASFVDNILKTGRITLDDYQKLVDDLNNSGVVFEVDMEVKVLVQLVLKVISLVSFLYLHYLKNYILYIILF